MKYTWLWTVCFLLLFAMCSKEGNDISIKKTREQNNAEQILNTDNFNDEQQNYDFEVETLSYDQLTNEPAFAEVSSHFGGLDSYMASEIDANFKGDSKGKKFKIIKEDVKVVKGPDWSTYTFRVRRKNNNKNRIIENLTLSYRAEDKEAYLVRLKLDKKWVKENKDKEYDSTPISGTYEMKKIERNVDELFNEAFSSKTCGYTKYVVTYIPCGCVGHFYWEINQCQCLSDLPKRITELIYVPCDQNYDDSTWGGGGNEGGVRPDSENQGITVCGSGSWDGGSFECSSEIGTGGGGNSTGTVIVTNLEDLSDLDNVEAEARKAMVDMLVAEMDEECSNPSSSNNDRGEWGAIEDDEPKWGQVGTKQDILDEIDKISNFNSRTLDQQLSLLKERFERNRMFSFNLTESTVHDKNPQNNIKRYVYTTKWGWVDMGHVIGMLYHMHTNRFGEDIGFMGVDLYEIVQLLNPGNYSGYSYEDLPSNAIGVAFYNLLFPRIKNGDLSWKQAISQMFNSLGAVDPSEAPNYEYLPSLLDGKYAKNFSTHGLIGDELRDKTFEAYCEKSLVTRWKIALAHAFIKD